MKKPAGTVVTSQTCLKQVVLRDGLTQAGFRFARSCYWTAGTSSSVSSTAKETKTIPM